MSRVEAVSAVHDVLPDPGGDPGYTAIDKRPALGPVVVGGLGLAGDRQCDTRHHGGPDKAVYAYAGEDADWWATTLGRDVPPGLFGDNLRTRGLDVTGALVGEVWRVGDGGLEVEVTQPRQPCMTFQRRMGEQHWVKRFTANGAPGAYLRVRTPGPAAAGDEVEVVHRPTHGVSIGAWFTGATPALATTLLEADAMGEIALAASLRRAVDHQARHARDAVRRT